MNIFILDKNYNQIGMLSNEGANPQAPYFDDLYTQELDTGADTFYFTTLSTSASRDFIEIGNHIIFQFNNRHRLFAISDLEFEHKEGRNVIGVYAEGVGFQLLETFMGEFEGGDDTDGDGEVDNNSGEFLTYDMFLEKVLKDTDWNYQIMSGDLTNINMGKEVHFSNGKNIYALLQDSIQEFGGVELEFRAEYAGGSLNKTVYAYPHKGRGSFVGQRFEYGHNVAGIKKKQEVVDGLDENEEIILYEGFETVDGLNTELTYEVDFALRGYEVEELEIGDTHYIIDNDFEPAQFEARIGKIEISFSDPTKNKCYIANFKRITGSKPDNLTSDNIEDVVDDNLDDKLDELLEEKLGENFGEHNHDRLVYHDEYYNNDKIMKFSAHPTTVIEDDGSTSEGSSSFTLDFNNQMEMYLRARDNSETGYPNYNWLTFRIYNGISSGNYYTDVFTNSEDVVPYYHELQYIGALDRRWRAAYIENVFADYVGSIKMESCTYQLPFDRKDMIDVSEITESSSINKQDLLDFILNDVNIYKYMYKDTDKESEEAGLSDVGTYLGILSDSFMDHQSEDNCTWTSEVASLVMRNMVSDTDNDGDLDDETKHKSHTYNLPALVTTLIGAFQQYVENGGEAGGGDHSKCAEKEWVEEWCSNLELADKEMDKRLDALEAGGGSNIDLSDYATKKYVDDAIKAIELETGASIKNIYINSSDNLIFLLSDGTVINAGKIPSGGGSSYRIIDLPNPDWTTTLTNCFEGALIAEPDMHSDGTGSFTYIKPHIEKTQYTTNHYIEFAVHAANYQNIDDARIYYKGCGMGNALPTFCPAPGFATDLGAPIGDEYGSSWENVYASVGHFDKIHCNQILTPDGSEFNGSDFNKYFSYDDTAYYGANSLICNEPLVVTRLVIDSDENNGLIVLGDSRVEISNMYGVDSITFSDGSKLTSANSVATVNEDLLDEQQNTIQQQQETIANLEARIARLEEMLGINN